VLLSQHGKCIYCPRISLIKAKGQNKSRIFQRRWENMRNIKYVVYKEGKYYVSQCLNVDVSSFGESIDEAIASLKEAVSLYFEEHLLPY
jgi:predicted RNase H-like HicB family nuclease